MNDKTRELKRLPRLTELLAREYETKSYLDLSHDERSYIAKYLSLMAFHIHPKADVILLDVKRRTRRSLFLRGSDGGASKLQAS
jgi:hypothetical protein